MCVIHLFQKIISYYCLPHSLYSFLQNSLIHTSFSFSLSCLLIFPYVLSLNFLIILSKHTMVPLFASIFLFLGYQFSYVICDHSSMAVCFFMQFLIIIANLTFSNYSLTLGIFSLIFHEPAYVMEVFLQRDFGVHFKIRPTGKQNTVLCWVMHA